MTFSITFSPRKRASLSVVDVKISFMMTMLLDVAASRISRIRTRSSSSLPRMFVRSSFLSKWTNSRSKRNRPRGVAGNGAAHDGEVMELTEHPSKSRLAALIRS